MLDKPATPHDFEAALAELEVIVSTMEGGQLPLSGALEAYQRGVLLLRQCQKTLDSAGNRIQSLDDAEGKLVPAASTIEKPVTP